jgi:molybdopterin converting factor small subunit
MKIAVRYMAQLRTAAGCAAELVEMDAAASPADLMVRLAERHGQPLAGLLLDADHQAQPTVLLFVGDEQVRADQPFALHDGDAVTLLSPMAGG